ncbi:CHAT domain-containing protein [Streptomyces sp. NPDC127190]|uniref:CHAT domain-containing protein n=1 Tax=unclassified Streptomyces TaxID=2593676 RepID=UPI0036271E85
MRLHELFPSVAAHVPAGAEVSGHLGDPPTVLAVAQILREQQDRLSDSPRLLDQFTLGVLSDVQRLRAADPAVPEAACVALAMLTCWVPARHAFEHAQPLEMWRWLHSAFGAPVTREAGTADIDLAPLDRALRSDTWTVLVQPALIMLAPVLFHLNTTAQTAEELARQLCQPVLGLCRALLARGDVFVVEAAVHLVKYLVRQEQRDDARELGHALEELLYARPGHPMAGAIAVLLSGEQPPITHRRPDRIAQWALGRLTLNPYTVLALSTNTAVRMSAGELAAFFPTVLSRLETVVGLVEQEEDAAQRSRDRGTVWSMSGPLVHSLLQAGDVERLMQWVSVWYGVGPGERRTGRCIVLAAGGSRAWYRPQTAPSSGDNAALVRLTAAMNAALGQSLVTTGLADTALTTPATGRKSFACAGELEDALLAYLDVADLADYAGSEKAEAFVSTLPALTPVQALLARRSGPVLPLAVSLRQPLADRSVAAVQLWCGDAPFARAEAEVLKTVFSYAGIRCDVVDGDEVTCANFLASYERDDYDVLWVAAHGRHPLLDPDHSAILLTATEQVPLADLAAAPLPPTAGRRLLVLNTCDSAAANAQGPYDDHGPARSVAGPRQAVIGHLWPVPGGAAVVFGALLACELADGSEFARAFAEALRRLQDPWPDLARRLGDRGIGAQIAEALDDFRDPTLLDWGSPAFLE